MPEPIRRLTLAQFRLLLPSSTALSRRLDAVHLHHTWKPRHADFRGLSTIEAMRDYHLSLGWEDIAQHLTIDPQGGLWTGRNWNRPPASSKGHNGSHQAGPFMIEMVGDFDSGQDPFGGAQRDAVLGVIAHVLATYSLGVNALRLHRELNQNQKTCPGSAIDRKALEKSLQVALRKKPAPMTRVFAAEHLLGFEVTRSRSGTLPSVEPSADATVPEHEAAAAIIEAGTKSHVAGAQRARRSRDFGQLLRSDRSRGEDWSMLRPHVVNLSKGELSEGGEFETSPADLDLIVAAVADYAADTSNAQVMLHAHGGLVSEVAALTYAKRMRQWWLSKGVYPIFFVWETSLLETLGQFVFGARDLADWTTDLAIEVAAKPFGTGAWMGMKESAKRASSANLGGGFPGGARLFVSKLAQRAETKSLPYHAVGHSAGAIFHAHLVPVMLERGLTVGSLSLLAPACRTELFKQMLVPHIESGAVRQHHLFTMDEEAERADNCFKVYRKSLLYLVSRSFESLGKKPILGLEQSLRKDNDLSAFYGLGQAGRPNVEIQFSVSRDQEENPLTRSLAHGDFDNDHKTMSSVLRRIVGVSDDTGLGEADFPDRPLDRALDLATMMPGRTQLSSPPATSGPALRLGGGQRVALCIGIDRYRKSPLTGCVNDAKAWGRTLAALDFDVRYLLDEQATQAAMLDAFQSLVSSARAGDVVVMQYAGHGTQLPDDNGDESDGFDEAFVPVDYHTGALFLRDDAIGTALQRLAPGALLTLFMDCCHCGTISRFAPAARAVETDSDRVRYLELPLEVVRASRAARRARGASRVVEGSAPGVIHLAACRDDEFAWESGGQGDFTGAATRVLTEAVNARRTNEDFMTQVAQVVRQRGRQHPLMMPPAPGMAGRRLLAAAASDGPPARPASAVSGSADAQLLQHLEAAVALLRARV